MGQGRLAGLHLAAEPPRTGLLPAALVGVSIACDALAAAGGGAPCSHAAAVTLGAAGLGGFLAAVPETIALRPSDGRRRVVAALACTLGAAALAGTSVVLRLQADGPSAWLLPLSVAVAVLILAGGRLTRGGGGPETAHDAPTATLPQDAAGADGYHGFLATCTRRIG